MAQAALDDFGAAPLQQSQAHHALVRTDGVGNPMVLMTLVQQYVPKQGTAHFDTQSGPTA